MKLLIILNNLLKIILNKLLMLEIKVKLIKYLINISIKLGGINIKLAKICLIYFLCKVKDFVIKVLMEIKMWKNLIEILCVGINYIIMEHLIRDLKLYQICLEITFVDLASLLKSKSNPKYTKQTTTLSQNQKVSLACKSK
jgi:hypothetical protein